jgi:hypothetical protein
MEQGQDKLLLSDRLINAMKANFGDLFVAYFNGAPELIAESALPCLIVQPLSGKGSVGATMTDDVTQQTMIHILANGKDGFGSSDDNDSIMHYIEKLVQGVDPVTGEYSQNSVLHVLRQNITLNTTIIDSDVAWDYNVTPRTDQPSIMEAIVTVTTTERAYLANRY